MKHPTVTVARYGIPLALLLGGATFFGCAGLALLPGGRAMAASGSETLSPQAQFFNARYLEARLMLSVGQPTEALAALKECREVRGCPPAVFEALAETYLLLNQPDQAEATLLDGLKRYPQAVALSLMQARYQRQAGQIDEAIETLNQTLEAAPRRDDVLGLLSELHLSRLIGNPEDSRKEIVELTRIYNLMLDGREGRDRLMPLLVLSTLYPKIDESEKAVAAAREALAIQPGSSRIMEAYASALVAAGKIDEAIDAYRGSLIEDPADDDVRRKLDALLVGQGGAELRDSYYQKMAEEHPENAGVQRLAARVLMRAKRWDEAERSLTRLLALDPGDLASQMTLFNLWIQKGDVDRALSEAKTLGSRGGEFAPAVMLSVAEALESRGHTDAAMELLESYHAANPLNENVALGLVALLIENDQPQRAEQVLNRIKEKAPDNFTAVALLAEVYAFESRFDEAHQLLKDLPEPLLKTHAGDIVLLGAGLRLNEAGARQEEKKWDEADALYRQGVELLDTLPAEPVDEKNNARALDLRTGALLNRGIIAQDQGRHAEAEQLYQQALQLNPGEAETWNTLGYFYAETNQKLDQGLTLIQKALELKPGAPHILDSLGWLYFRQGKIEDAIRELEKSVLGMADEPESAEVYSHLGDAYAAAGRKIDAQKAWQKALDLGGDDVAPETLRAKLTKIAAPGT